MSNGFQCALECFSDTFDRLSELTQHFLEAFSQLRPPEEAQLARRIIRQYKGGIIAVRSNEVDLYELFAAEGTGGDKNLQDIDNLPHQRSNGRNAQKAEYSFIDFKLELREDVDVSLRNNFKAFEVKFQLFYVRLEDNLHKYMREEGDRVIEEVTKGPHNLVKDPVCISAAIILFTYLHTVSLGTQDDLARNGMAVI